MADTRTPTALENALAALGEAMSSGDDAAITAAREQVAAERAKRDANRGTAYGAKEVPCYWSSCDGRFATAESAKIHAGWDEPVDVEVEGLGPRDRVYIRRYCADGATAMAASNAAKRAAKR